MGRKKQPLADPMNRATNVHKRAIFGDGGTRIEPGASAPMSEETFAILEARGCVVWMYPEQEDLLPPEQVDSEEIETEPE